VCEKRAPAVLLIAFSVFFEACSKSDTGKSSINSVEKSVVMNGNTIETDKKFGGQITIIAGAGAHHEAVCICFAASGRLSFFTTNASHSFPSGARPGLVFEMVKIKQFNFLEYDFPITEVLMNFVLGDDRL